MDKRYTGERRNGRRDFSSTENKSRGRSRHQDRRSRHEDDFHGEYEISDDYRHPDEDQEDSNFYRTEHFSYGSPSPSDHNFDYGPGWGATEDPDSRREGHDSSMWETVKNFFGKGPKGYKRSDERIHEEVCEALSRHPAIDASEIEVTVEDGVVVLKGLVDSRRVKKMAEDTADRALGVKNVGNELQIALPTNGQKESDRPN